MKRLDFRSVVVVLLAAAGGCKGDPTADLRTGVSQLALNPDLMFIDQGATKPFEVVVRDQQLNPVAADVTVTSLNPSLATVAVDSSVPSADNAHHDFIVTAVAPGVAKLVATAGAVSDTAEVTVFPPAFNGTVSTKTPIAGDTVLFFASALLKFDPTAVSVTAPGKLDAPVVSASPETLAVLTPFAAPGRWTIAGVRAVTYPAGLVVSLQTTDSIAPTGRMWTGDTNYTTAPTIAVPTTAGASTFLITNLEVPANGPRCAEFGPPAPANSIGPCVIYKFTVADTTSLVFTTGWNSTGDMDTYTCDDTGLPGCFEDGGSGAGSANPEVIKKFKFPAGTHYFVVEQFRGPKPGNIHVEISHP